MYVVASRHPVTYVERQDDDQRVFLVIGAANWLLHQCVISEE